MVPSTYGLKNFLRENVLTDLFKESIFLFRDDERVQRKCESGTTHTRRDMEDP